MGYEITKDRRIYNFHFCENAVNEFIESAKRIEISDMHFIPYKRYVLAKIFLEIFGPKFTDDMFSCLKDYQSGCLFLHFKKDLTKEDCVRISTAISHQINRPSASDPSGMFYAFIEIVDGNNTEMKLYEPYKDFPLHTDGVFKDNPVDWLMMLKVSELSALGGESRLLHMEDWEGWDEFFNRPENQNEYMHGLHERDKRYEVFSKVSSTEPSFSKILSLKEGKRSIKFVDQYVVPTTIDEAIFMEELQYSLENSSGVVQTKLPVGSMILINNNFWMHGRSKFDNSPSLYRELLRQYGCFKESNLLD